MRPAAEDRQTGLCHFPVARPAEESTPATGCGAGRGAFFSDRRKRKRLAHGEVQKFLRRGLRIVQHDPAGKIILKPASMVAGIATLPVMGDGVEVQGEEMR